MVQVVVNNTTDPSLWQPIEAACRVLGARFHFVNLPRCEGFKAGALNRATALLGEEVELVGIVDADYVVRPEFLTDCVPHFADPTVAFLQTPQHYREWSDSPYLRGLFYACSRPTSIRTATCRSDSYEHGRRARCRERTCDITSPPDPGPGRGAAFDAIALLQRGLARAVSVPGKYQRSFCSSVPGSDRRSNLRADRATDASFGRYRDSFQRAHRAVPPAQPRRPAGRRSLHRLLRSGRLGADSTAGKCSGGEPTLQHRELADAQLAHSDRLVSALQPLPVEQEEPGRGRVDCGLASVAGNCGVARESVARRTPILELNADRPVDGVLESRSLSCLGPVTKHEAAAGDEKEIVRPYVAMNELVAGAQRRGVHRSQPSRN